MFKCEGKNESEVPQQVLVFKDQPDISQVCRPVCVASLLLSGPKFMLGHDREENQRAVAGCLATARTWCPLRDRQARCSLWGRNLLDGPRGLHRYTHLGNFSLVSSLMPPVKARLSCVNSVKRRASLRCYFPSLSLECQSREDLPD